MNSPVIEFSDFSFRYHDGSRESLSKINFSIQKGEFILFNIAGVFNAIDHAVLHFFDRGIGKLHHKCIFFI